MLCLFSLFSFPFGGFLFVFFLLPATKGSEAGGGRDPRARTPPDRSGGMQCPGAARLTGMWCGPCGEEQRWRPAGPLRYLTGGPQGPTPLLGDPHFLIGFQWGAGPGGLSPAVLMTGMEPCECSCAPPGLVFRGITASPPPPPHRLHPRGCGWRSREWQEVPSRRLSLLCPLPSRGPTPPKTQNLP